MHVGFAHYVLGNWEQAEQAVLIAHELNPLNLNIILSLGELYRNKRQFQKAEYYFNLLVQRNPEQAWSYVYMAWNYLKGFGDFNKARSFLQEAELNVQDPEELLRVQCWTEIYARDFTKALSYAKNRKIYSPGSLLLGEAYYHLEQKDLAQAEFDSMRIYWEDKVIEDPENAPFHSTLGKVYAHLGLKEKAIAEGQMAVDLLPVAKNHWLGPYRIRDLALIYTLTSEQVLAINNIEYLLAIRSVVTKWSLRLDPIFDPLRENPRFQKLIASEG